MAIKMVKVECPSCGAMLDIEEDRKMAFCTYCGTKVLIDNDNEYTYRHVDEARIYEAETDRYVRMEKVRENRRREEAEYRIKKYKLIGIAALVGFGVLFITIGFSFDINGLAMGGIWMLLGAMYIGIFSMDKNGKNRIKIPDSVKSYSGKDYAAVKEILKSAGFKNVVCVPLNDLTKAGFFSKPGRIQSIVIDGEDIDEGHTFYEPDANIVISYHSLIK